MKSNSLSWSNKNDLSEIVHTLKRGGVVLGASDTVIGLLVDATMTGIQKLNAIKQRAEKPYIILVDGPEKISRFAVVPHVTSAEKIMRAAWPGPVTLIFKANPASPLYDAFPQKTVAIRIPAHDGLLQVLKQFDGLLSTSANRAGNLVPSSMQEVDPALRAHVDACITNGDVMSVPSTILDCSGDGIVLVREGAYPIAELERIAAVRIAKS